MSKSNITGNDEEKDIRSQVHLFVYRIPKKNHDAIMQMGKQANDLFKKHDVLQQVFQLNTSKANEDMGFTNLAKTVSANQDEEVWVEINSYRDRKHMDEVSAKMQSDESAGELVRKFMGLITPGSCIVGELGRLRVQSV